MQYLGFILTPEDILPEVDFLKAVKNTEVPKTVEEASQFTGLCNLFRSQIKFLRK
jgi:hypothetical protein